MVVMNDNSIQQSLEAYLLEAMAISDIQINF